MRFCSHVRRVRLGGAKRLTRSSLGIYVDINLMPSDIPMR